MVAGQHSMWQRLELGRLRTTAFGDYAKLMSTLALGIGRTNGQSQAGSESLTHLML